MDYHTSFPRQNIALYGIPCTVAVTTTWGKKTACRREMGNQWSGLALRLQLMDENADTRTSTDQGWTPATHTPPSMILVSVPLCGHETKAVRECRCLGRAT